MHSALRFVGIINAAIWLGAGIFFSFGIAPAVFSPELKKTFSDYQVGLIAQQLIGRFFLFHLICGSIALAHFFAELVVLRRGFRRWLFIVLVTAFGFGLGGGSLLQPRMRTLFETKYHGATETDRTAAAKQFGALHGVSQIANLATLMLLIAYAWRLSLPSAVAPAVQTPKFGC